MVCNMPIVDDDDVPLAVSDLVVDETLGALVNERRYEADLDALPSDPLDASAITVCERMLGKGAFGEGMCTGQRGLCPVPGGSSSR